MTKKTFLWVFTAALVGLGLGVYVGVEYRASPSGPAVPPEQSATLAEVVALREEVERLRKALEGQQVANAAVTTGDGTAAPGKSSPAAWSLLADLQQRKLATPRITFVTESGKLTDAFANLFALDAAERAALQRVLDQASDQLADLQRRNATVARGDDGSVSITIKSFAVEGGAVYDQLMKGFAQTLGADRNAAFVKLGSEQVERALGRFGAPDYVYTFKSRPTPDGRSFEVSEKHKLPQENGTSNSSYRSWAEVQNRLGPVARLVPPDFAPPE